MGENQPFRHILILDDDADYRNLLVKNLRVMFPDVELTEYDPVAEGIPGESYDWSRYDIMLLDYNLSLHDVTGLDILRKHAGKPDFPATIMLTGAGNEDVAIRAMKSGVYDYLRKQTLKKEKLRESIQDTYTSLKAALKQKDAVTEARMAANKAAEKAFEEYKTQYEKVHAEEIKRLQEELNKFHEELEQSRKLLKKVEMEKYEAVRSLEDIERELVRFRKETVEDAETTLSETNNKLEELNRGIKDSERMQEYIEGEIQKNLWKQEQGQMKIEQIEEDLKLFNEEFGTQYDDDKALVKEYEKQQKTKLKSDREELRKKEEDLLTEVSSQLFKKDKKN